MLFMVSLAKAITFLIIVLLIVSLISIQPLTVKAQPKTITVPDDYPTIQDAVGNATAGDTIFVKAGFYPVTFHNDGLIIDKPLTLVGENSGKTIIDANYRGGHYRSRSIITIESDNVSISGFTLNNIAKNVTMQQLYGGSGYVNDTTTLTIRVAVVGIWDEGFSNCKITHTIISDCDGAIQLGNGQDNVISENIIKDCGTGISAYDETNAFISKNTLTNNTLAIDYSGSTIIKNNVISNGNSGIRLESKGASSVSENTIIENSGYGFKFLISCQNCSVYRNDFRNNGVGISLDNYTVNELATAGSGNVVYYNNFIDNSNNAFVEHNILEQHYPVYNRSELAGSTAQVSWDNGKVGNYWSEYSGQGSYVIDENNVDHHPLTQQVDISAALPIALIATGIVAIAVIFLLYRWRRKISKQQTKAA